MGLLDKLKKKDDVSNITNQNRKTRAFFEDLSTKNNVVLLDSKDEIAREFSKIYNDFQDKFFFEQFISSGGIIIDNWIRLYGCGELNVVEKNKLYNCGYTMDILIAEDILGGLFGLKDDYIYYFAPDSNEWECLEVYYTQFLNWLINNTDDVHKFYEYFRWNTWREDCAQLKLSDGYSFYPLLQVDSDINQRSRKVISIDELIRLNLGI
ncbi:MAG: DUF2625 domain-containing protein [Erysipelotrichaceae bacterium]|nr:DUF2625 domain-containing protein [Erysipelotrichaceae bacterium]